MTDLNLQINELQQRIWSLEKNNQNLMKKMNSISVDIVMHDHQKAESCKNDISTGYLNQNVLVYNDTKQYFYIYFGLQVAQYEEEWTEKESIMNSQLIGYYFDEIGWHPMFLDNNIVYIYENVDEIEKEIDTNRKFLILQNKKMKTIVFPNATSINIFSNYRIDFFSVFDF